MAAGLPDRRMLLRPSEELPLAAAVGLRFSLPAVVLLHGAMLGVVVQASVTFDPARLPASPAPDHVIRFFAPPAAALPVGSADAPRDPERTAPPTFRGVLPVPLEPIPLAELRHAADRAAAETFGAPEGLPEGLFDGLPFGRAEGVVGGRPDGVPGGQIGGLRTDADPVLPPPDQPPVPIAMPRPGFPAGALRDGVRGRVVLRALITERGAVEVLRVLRSVPGLDAEAVRVVEAEWRFRPAQRNGRPVAALSDLTVRFSLR